MVTMGKKTKKDKSDVIVKPEDIVTDTVMVSAADSEEELKKSKKKKKKEKKEKITDGEIVKVEDRSVIKHTKQHNNLSFNLAFE